MMDLDRKKMDKRAGPGGVKCLCCYGRIKGRKDPTLRRAVRRKNKLSIKEGGSS